MIIMYNDLFDERVYNILTHNLTVRKIVETIKIIAPKLKVEFVNSKIINQLSYEVLCERFKDQGVGLY